MSILTTFIKRTYTQDEITNYLKGFVFNDLDIGVKFDDKDVEIDYSEFFDQKPDRRVIHAKLTINK